MTTIPDTSEIEFEIDSRAVEYRDHLEEHGWTLDALFHVFSLLTDARDEDELEEDELEEIALSLEPEFWAKTPTANINANDLIWLPSPQFEGINLFIAEGESWLRKTSDEFQLDFVLGWLFSERYCDLNGMVDVLMDSTNPEIAWIATIGRAYEILAWYGHTEEADERVIEKLHTALNAESFPESITECSELSNIIQEVREGYASQLESYSPSTSSNC